MNSLRFLLVHRDPGHSEQIVSVLADANHTVLPTTGLDEASDALTVERFDAILLESAFLSQGLGEFSAKLRSLENGQRLSLRVPIIALGESGILGSSPNGDGPQDRQNGDDAESAYGSEPDLDAFLPEPIDPLALTDAVRRLAHALTGTQTEPEVTNYSLLPVIEPDKFDEQVGYDSELKIEIIDLFLDERQRQEVEMRDALEKGDMPALFIVAHTIKGSLGSLHATRARAQAQDLELAARSGDEEASWRFFAELEAGLAELEPELKALRRVADAP